MAQVRALPAHFPDTWFFFFNAVEIEEKSKRFMGHWTTGQYSSTHGQQSSTSVFTASIPPFSNGRSLAISVLPELLMLAVRAFRERDSSLHSAD